MIPAVGQAVLEDQFEHGLLVREALAFPEITGVCEKAEREFEHFREGPLRLAGFGEFLGEDQLLTLKGV